MEPTGREAEPIAKGFLPGLKQNFLDLFKWEQRVEILNEYGEARYEWMRPTPLRNPFSLMAQLTASNWLYFAVGLASWTADAFDFHALSIQTVKLAAYYDRTNTDISTAITLTLLLRSVGAAFFGAAGDRYGRKWPMVINMLVLGLLQIATIYAATFQQFLAVRSLFGLFMGGVYGNAIAMALENAPVELARIWESAEPLKPGKLFLYVSTPALSHRSSKQLAVIVFHIENDWIAAGLSIGVGLVRIAFPESKQFRDRKAAGNKSVTAGVFWGEVRVMLAKEWRLCIYTIILMTWFNFYSHTSQDSYTTFLRTEKGMNNAVASTASILMKTGACVGGTIIGYLSQWVGLTYQLGNMISSPSAQIVNAIAESISISAVGGPSVPAYGPTMAIMTAIIALGIAVTTVFGPEKRGRRFESAVIGQSTEINNAQRKEGDIEKGDQVDHVESK
ncbi:hypothetical protein Q7P35_006088 [Cladosporium inversicolor]